MLREEERSSGRGVSTSFQAWTEKKWLIDLGYEGVAFTWSHGVSLMTRRAAQLDRSLCDDVWRRIFPSAKVKHLPHAYSDHCPLLIMLEDGGSEERGKRPF